MIERDKAAEWLTGLVLGAAAAMRPESSGLVSKNLYDGTAGVFEIFGTEEGKPIAATKEWSLYAAQLPSGQLGLMKIASRTEHNYALKQEVNVLQRMQDIATAIDNDTGSSYNYGAYFPTVVESFDADGRAAVFLGFHESITTYKQFTPLSPVTRDERVDFKTGVWLLGKQLKVLDFMHGMGKIAETVGIPDVSRIAIGQVNASNLLIEPEQHGVFYFDFSGAVNDPTDEECLAEVSAAAEIVLHACGGGDDMNPPHDAEIMTVLQHDEFVTFLRRMIEHPTMALVEHEALYELADRIWPKVPGAGGILKRQFHTLRTYPR